MSEKSFASVATIFGDFSMGGEKLTTALLKRSSKSFDELSADLVMPPRFSCGDKKCETIFCCSRNSKLCVEVFFRLPASKLADYCQTLEVCRFQSFKGLFYVALKALLFAMESVFGRDNIRLVHLLDFIADYAQILNRTNESIDYHNRSLTLKHNWWGRKHLSRARNLEALAQANMESGDFISAESDFLESIHIRELHLRNRYSNIYFSRLNRQFQQVELAKAIASACKLAQVYAEKGMFVESETRFECAIELLHIAALPYGPQLSQAAGLLLENYRTVLNRAYASRIRDRK